MQKIESQDGYLDDICGFRKEIDSPLGCGFIDTVDVAWVADNNGREDDNAECPSGFDLTSVAGVRIIRTPLDDLDYSFNWWVSNSYAPDDWGPQRVASFRNFEGVLGTPLGDRSKYHILRNREFDYDQLMTAIDHTQEGWLPPPDNKMKIADGFDTRYLLSFGPFDIDPMATLPITFAFIMGENFHRKCEAEFYPDQPDNFYDQLDFSDLGLNALWASWVYDNPGYDSDSDHYRGEARVCVFDSSVTFDTLQFEPELIIETTVVYLDYDSIWYKGDSIPDFRGASPPPPPSFQVIPRIDGYNRGELRLHWNGYESEATRDVFSQEMDFEGYRIYLSLTPRLSGYTLLASYDREDYNKYIYDRNRGEWELLDPPFTLDSLRELYGMDFNPLDYSIDHLFAWRDSLFYFTGQDWNQSDYTDTCEIHKIYPDEPVPPTLNIDSAMIYYPEALTDEGQFKYFEYGYVIRNLLPSQLYYVAITAFDYGSPKSGLESLESSPLNNKIAEYAQNQTSIVESEDLKVIVYPNPYRIDADYRANGFEGLGMDHLSDDRVRAIHFTNLPHKCTIRIFTIDGDLVREIKHDYPPDSPQSMHDTWDMITRNTQAPASGIYYYMVESEYGNQIGKLVLIM